MFALSLERTASQIVSILKEERETLWEDKKILQEQIRALQRCKKEEVAVEELWDLDVYLHLTNDNRTSEQSKEIINATITKLKVKENKLEVKETV